MAEISFFFLLVYYIVGDHWWSKFCHFVADEDRGETEKDRERGGGWSGGRAHVQNTADSWKKKVSPYGEVTLL